MTIFVEFHVIKDKLFLWFKNWLKTTKEILPFNVQFKKDGWDFNFVIISTNVSNDAKKKA